MPSVLNTTAGISGKTVCLLEGAQTIVGAKTFSLGASAPFICVVGAAKVDNLDADKLDGQEGTYYTNASNLASGTVPLARLANLTNAEIAAAAAIAWTKIDKTGSSLADLATRSASDLSSGTLPDARFPATLPVASGANLTNLNATNLASGTVPDARFPATLPAASGANLTALNGSNISSGTVAEARLGSGTGSVNKVLRGNNTWGDPPGITTDGASAIQQIAFAAAQSASAGANVMDDYEEGTWTPGISFDGASVGVTYNQQPGSYIKIGQLVIATGYVELTSKGSSTGTARVTGLPFTSNTGGQGYNAYGNAAEYVNMASIADLQCTVSSNTTTATLRNGSGTNSSSLNDTHFNNNSAVGITVCYRASA